MSEVTTTNTQAVFASITENLGLMADLGKALQNGSRFQSAAEWQSGIVV